MVAALTAMLVLTGVVAGLVTGFFAGAAERGLYATGLWTRGGASTITPGTFDGPASAGPDPTAVGTPNPNLPNTDRPSTDLPNTDLPSPVLAPATGKQQLSAAKVAARIRAVNDREMGGTYSAEVGDLSTGMALFQHRAASPAIPASTLKLLTATTVLSLLGPDHEFTTKVLRVSAGRIVLVGGGDPYLAGASAAGHPERASLAVLAASTAAELNRSKVTTVRLDYDDTLFSGPAWNPRWPGTYADQVTPVSALWIDEGRTAGYSPGPRASDPAGSAARTFAAALKARGITVATPRAGRAPLAATTLARVQSMPLQQVVEAMLLASDNDAAEVLLRQAALASGGRGSAADGVRALRAELTKLGLWDRNARVVDGSGLARDNQVSADTLVKVLRTAASDQHPELRAVLTGLPVAGVEGSLAARFFDKGSADGRGVVRGKTGTLSKVHSLAGYLRTADGVLVVFAFVVNDATDDYAAQRWLDRVSTALSRCGC